MKIFLPEALFLEGVVSRVIAEGPQGSFALLPRHIDMATALRPGILSFVTGGEEAFVALEGGMLVKMGDEVLVATRSAVKGELGVLRREVERMVSEVEEKERKARSAVARLEADFVRRFVEFGRK